MHGPLNVKFAMRSVVSVMKDEGRGRSSPTTFVFCGVIQMSLLTDQHYYFAFVRARVLISK